MGYKKVLVTGAFGGIGEIIVKFLQAVSYEVCSWPKNLNVALKSDWIAVREQIGEDIWAVVNCAGIAEAKGILDVSATTFMNMMEVNALAILHSIQVFAPDMIKKHKYLKANINTGRNIVDTVIGHFVNITSISGLIGFSSHAHYCASKFAANGLSQVAAKELAKYGILVNCVCPGPTQTPMWDKLDIEYSALNGVEPGEMDYMQKQLIKRLGTPADTAAMVRWLISSENTFVTGTNVKVCGGNLIG